jgi:hypothetical protein
MIKNLNVLQVIESSVKTEKGVIKMSFVEGYWLELVVYKGQVKGRFRFLDESSSIRRWFEELLNVCEVERKYVRFFNVDEVYLTCKERKDQKKSSDGEVGNIVLFYAVVPRKKIEENENDCQPYSAYSEIVQ